MDVFYTHKSGEEPIILTIVFLFIFFQVSAKNDENSLFVKNALQSNSIDKHIVAGLLASSYELTFSDRQLYEKALKLDPNNVLLLDLFIRMCDSQQNKSFCEKEKNIKKLIKLDPENALINLYAAIYYDEHNKPKKALNHLQSGATKNKFEEYTWKYLQLSRQELTKAKYPKQQVMVASLQNTHIIDLLNSVLNKGLKLCLKKSQKSNAWKKACIDYGETMELRSSSILSIFIGFAFQRDVLRIDKNDELEWENVKHRRNVFHQFRLRVVNQIKWASMLGFENEVPEIFWTELFKYGERVAYQRALDRVLIDSNDQ